MSHFTCLVVTDTPDQLDAALQPFHEYECTGVKDQYVIFQPADESQEDFEKTHKEHLEKYPDSTEKELNDFIPEWYGYELRDGVWGRETNPNAKWDWWVIGGRWSGLLRAKQGTDGVKGRPGLMGSEFDRKGVDQVRVGDLDMKAMLDAQQQNIREYRTKEFEKQLERCKNGDVPNGAGFMLEPDAFEKWDQLSVDMQEAIDHLRSVWEQVGNGKSFSDFIDAEKDEGNPRALTVRLGSSLGYCSMFGVTPGQTMKQAIDSVAPVCTFAVLMDGKWYERGSMGWWGCVSDEDDQWESRFKELFESLDQDKYVTVVDCHI